MGANKGKTMPEDSFDNPELHMRIAADVLRIQSALLEWDASPTAGALDEKIVETLVATFDAYGRTLLQAVNVSSELPGYHKSLRFVASRLIQSLEKNLSEPFSDSRLRQMAENSGDLTRRKHFLTPAQQETETRKVIEQFRSELMPEALKSNERKNQLLFVIECRFEARHQHWAAEAIESLLRKSKPSDDLSRSNIASSKKMKSARKSREREVGAESRSFGRKANAETNRIIAGIVESFPNRWRKCLAEVCEALNEQQVPLPRSGKWKARGCKDWTDVLSEDQDGLVKALQHRLDWVSEHPLDNPIAPRG